MCRGRQVLTDERRVDVSIDTLEAVVEGEGNCALLQTTPFAPQLNGCFQVNGIAIRGKESARPVELRTQRKSGPDQGVDRVRAEDAQEEVLSRSEASRSSRRLASAPTPHCTDCCHQDPEVQHH